MNASSIIRPRTSRLFDITIYLTLAVLVTISLIIFSDPQVRVLIVVLCSIFGLVNRFGYYAISTPRQAAAYFTFQTLLLTCLIALAQASDVFGLLFFTLGIQAVMILLSRISIICVVLFYAIESGTTILYRGPDAIVSVLFNVAVFVLTFVFTKSLRETEIARDQNQQ